MKTVRRSPTGSSKSEVTLSGGKSAADSAETVPSTPSRRSPNNTKLTTKDSIVYPPQSSSMWLPMMRNSRPISDTGCAMLLPAASTAS